MIEKIAIAQDASGLMRNVAQTGDVVVFERGGEGWKAIDSFLFEPEEEMSGFRFALERLVQRLGECKILAGRKIEGITYHTLNRHGFHLFEIDQVDDSVMDRMIQDTRDFLNENKPVVHKVPFSSKQDGHYYLDLIKLQEEYPEISSKKAIRSFLENEIFHSFTLLCIHLPPWVNEVARHRQLNIKEERLSEGTCKITITPTL